MNRQAAAAAPCRLAGPSCSGFQAQHSRALRAAVARLVNVTRPSVSVSCLETEAAATAAARAGPATQTASSKRLSLSLQLGPYSPSRGSAVFRRLRRALVAGRLGSVLRGALPSPPLVVQELPSNLPRLVCTSSAGGSCTEA